MTAPVLKRPDEQWEFFLYTDASQQGLGAVVSQKDDQGRERVIAYGCRGLSPAEKNYNTTEQEALAVIWAVKKYHHWLVGTKFTIVSDHEALKHLLNNSKLPNNARLVRWILELQNYTFETRY